ncbi:tRNA-splicing endonuclease subunit Sen2-1-like isoform X1 [Citrus sinensis]|nr:tRNA-splicing endonuclease subunit Sen2-1 isoform X1 [Citrus x clementina]XP_006488175.1 tRNA-splicing endonuclease subunit Sen2-1-like isoform X1 [Citrus sinensis]
MRLNELDFVKYIVWVLSFSNSALFCKSINQRTPIPNGFAAFSLWGCCSFLVQFPSRKSMGPRWKGRASEAKALADPMSKIISDLHSSLVQSEAHAVLAGYSALLAVEAEQTELLNRACFGRPIVTAEKDKQWYQLGMEEGFYLCHSLKCLKIVGEDNSTKNDDELWQYMKAKKETFPLLYKAYSHLRKKNWVVRSGSQYGVDFVAYRHHPSLVHSEYAVLVLAEGEDGENGRLRVWSDIHCTVRLCGGVAKTLLILTINKNGQGTATPSCLEQYAVEERTISRWSPEQCREDPATVANGIK